MLSSVVSSCGPLGLSEVSPPSSFFLVLAAKLKTSKSGRRWDDEDPATFSGPTLPGGAMLDELCKGVLNVTSYKEYHCLKSYLMLLLRGSMGQYDIHCFLHSLSQGILGGQEQ